MRTATSVLLAALAAGTACGIPDANPGMKPGDDCLRCHDGRAAQAWTVAGTLYRDPQAGAAEGAGGGQVFLEDAAGRALTLNTNGAGNFYTAEALRFPLTVEVELSGARMKMVAHPQSGSCNFCHAQPAQNSAPGRLFAAGSANGR